jgi:radical SAM-linked protein
MKTSGGITRIQIRFTKRGDLRWISHRDLARVWERLLRRADLELAFSQGFHPKPKISFPSALTLGIEALDEVVELELCGAIELNEVVRRIQSQMPSGMEMLSAEISTGKSRLVGATYSLEIPAELRESTQSQIQAVLAADVVCVQRDDKLIECTCRDAHFAIMLEGNKLVFSLPAAEHGASLRPSELLQLLHLEQLLVDGSVLQRTHVHLDQQTTPQHSLPS